MTKERKIQNAALYWYTCQKEGFPTGQKEVFQEWLDKDIQHSIIYKKLYNDPMEINSVIKYETEEKKKRKVLYPYFILVLLIILTSIFIIKL